jgi:hypothetical protein
VKQKRALVQTNPPRNSQLKLIETDEALGQATSLSQAVF